MGLFRRKQSEKFRVATLLRQRSLMYMCSYKTAWDSWMYEHEKDDFSFEEIKKEIHELHKHKIF